MSTTTTSTTPARAARPKPGTTPATSTDATTAAATAQASPAFLKTARRVAAGKMTFDEAVTEIAASTKHPRTHVREQLRIAVDAISAPKEAPVTQAKPKAAPAPKPPRVSKATVTFDQFLAVRDKHALSTKDLIAAYALAGEVRSSTYFFILTHAPKDNPAKGVATPELFAHFQDVVKAYVASQKAAKKKTPVAVVPEPDATSTDAPVEVVAPEIVEEVAASA